MNRIFTTLLVLASLTTVFATRSFSQSEEVQNSSENSSKFLQVNFINEAALYYHAPLSGRLSLRTGFSANWSYDEVKNGTEDGVMHYDGNPPDDVASHYSYRTLRNSYSINVSSLALYRCSDYEFAQAYVGFGPALTYAYYNYSSNSSEIVDTTTSRYGSNGITPSWGTGAALSLLVKCKLYRNVSIVSEYAFSATYYWQSERYSSFRENRTSSGRVVYTSGGENTRKTDGWRFNLGNIRIGLLIGL